MEEWKEIKGYEDRYVISPFGNVRNVKTGKEVVSNYMKGYKQIKLYKGDGKPKHFMVHRLVAEQFLSNTENKPCVNHKNGKKDDNHVMNLEWCTILENSRHYHQSNFNKKVVIKDLKGNILQEIDVNDKTVDFIYERI